MRHRQRSDEQAERGHLYDILFIVLLASAAYGAWKFGPPLKARWDIDRTTKAYVEKLSRNQRHTDISQKLYDLLDADGIDLDAVEIGIDYEATKPGTRISAPVLQWVEVTVEFTPVVNHIGGATTELDFTVSRRRIWDDSW